MVQQKETVLMMVLPIPKDDVMDYMNRTDVVIEMVLMMVLPIPKDDVMDYQINLVLDCQLDLMMDVLNPLGYQMDDRLD